MILALQCDPNFVLFCSLLDYRERAAKDSAHLQSGPVAGAELRTVHQTSHRLPLHLSGLHGNHDVMSFMMSPPLMLDREALEEKIDATFSGVY